MLINYLKLWAQVAFAVASFLLFVFMVIGIPYLFYSLYGWVGAGLGVFISIVTFITTLTFMQETY